MSQIARKLGALALLFVAVVAFPAGAFASTTHANLTTPETITIQVDVTTPTNTTVVGTVLVKRTPGTNVVDIEFNGTVNGKQAHATAKATETWGDNSQDTI